MSTSVEIEYCLPCGHLEQAINTRRAILQQFGRRLDGVGLKTGHGGVFTIRVDSEQIYDKTQGLRPGRHPPRDQHPALNARPYSSPMTILRSIGLFILAAIAEIGGAWLIWQGVREKRGLIYIGAGVIALGLYGFFATFQPSPHFGRILAAYGGIFVVGSLAWGIIFDGFRPDRYDIIGAAFCLLGVAVIMYAPRPGQ